MAFEDHSEMITVQNGDYRGRKICKGCGQNELGVKTFKRCKKHDIQVSTGKCSKCERNVLGCRTYRCSK